MIVPKGLEMPKATRQLAQTASTETVFSVDLTIPNKHLPTIRDTDLEGLDANAPISAKIAAIAEGALLDLCEGGQMLQPPVMRKLTESFGKVPAADDIVEQFSRGAGRKDGKLQITISLDPAYEAVVQQAADFQGVTPAQCLQNCWDTAWDNGDFYDPRPHADRVLMTNDMKSRLVKLLGKDFATGGELGDLVEKFVGEHEGLFADVGDK